VRHFVPLFCVMLVLSHHHTAAAVEDPPAPDFSSAAWTVRGELVEHLGRRALAGSAFLPDVRFTDGVIQVDVAVDGRRCFPGIAFRAQSEADTEIFYFRPHRSVNYSHTLQYTPRIRGLTGWQLYSGPGFTAKAEIPLDRWIPVRIEVKGSRARIFFNDLERPAVVVDDLVRGTAGGFIGVTGPSNGAVYWSNFRYSSGDELDFGPRPVRPPSRGDLAEWEISQPLSLAAINRDFDPLAQDLGKIEWKKVSADVSGLVDVARFLDAQPQLPACVVARTVITSDAADRRNLVFGYSDEVSVVLNGELLFRGDSTFRVRDTEFMGIIGLNDAVVLDLVEGANTLVFVVAENFGGWGFSARTEPLRTDPVELADGTAIAWQLTEGLVMPESAVWDPKRRVFYISNMNPAGPGGPDDTGFISRIDASGENLVLQWVTGLRSPTGTAVLGDRLYVVERPGVAVIDIDTATIVERWAIPSDGGFLNDLAVAGDGTVFVSDSGLGVVHRGGADGVEPWLEGPTFAGVNGLVVADGHLEATTMGSESLVGVDLETASVETIVTLRPFGGDGITAADDGAYLVTDFRGLLLRVTPAGGREVLVDSRGSGISLTDHAFAPELDLVLVPTLRGNSVMAFDLDAEKDGG